ncbi:hypothetical protein HELRODRAFT_183698 [Helobdella robusta]|uniref:Peptidase A2 domain-containing protein n=1 Tax=Helobdella robusta TaxID=6412 RepID=T1FK24_HELRO|nr:hypothetical protein HELRODRAFT_183698 [Helobdella robusta]ESO10374.1 hypothetical protein HELRODRAFT_183698 [Helobdella robusta]
MREKFAVKHLINAIGKKDMFYVKDKEPRTLDEICQLYEKYKNRKLFSMIDEIKRDKFGNGNNIKTPFKCNRDKEALVHVEAVFRTKHLKCLLDSGADVNLCPKKFADDLKIRKKFKYQNIFTTFYVSPNVDHIILGKNWLYDNNCIWDFGRSNIVINGKSYNLVKSRQETDIRCISKITAVIPPRSEMFIQTFIEKSNLKPLKQDTAWSTSINKIKTNLLTTRSLINVNKPFTCIRVCNIPDEKVELPKDQVITKLHEVVVVVDKVQESNNKPTKEYDETINTIVDEVHSSVPDNIRSNLRKLLLKYKNILSLSEFDLGRTNITQQEIATGANRPFRQALRPQPRAHLPIIDNLLEEMLQQKVIEPCQSE